MNLYKKNGNRTHDTLMLWTGTKSLFSNLAVSLWLKGVNLKPNIVPEWESNPRNLFKCEIENLSKVYKNEIEPWTIGKVVRLKFRIFVWCSKVWIQNSPMLQNGDRTQDILIENRTMFGNGARTHKKISVWPPSTALLFFLFIFLYLGLGGGDSQMLVNGTSCLWSWTLFIWAP